LGYTITALILLALALYAIALCVRRQGPQGPAVAVGAAGLAAATGVLLLLPLAAPLMSGPEHTLRFLAPTLIGSAVAIVILLGAFWPGWPGKALAAAVAAALVGLFWPSMAERAQYAWNYHTLRTYPHATEPFLLDYIHDSVGEGRRAQIASLQALVPPGEPIIAWVASPYFLDFVRNPIIDVEHSGTAMPWAGKAVIKMPRYVIWQHHGMVMESFEYLKRAARAPWAYAYDRRYYRAAAAFGTRLALALRSGAVIGTLRDKDEAWVVARLPPE